MTVAPMAAGRAEPGPASARGGKSATRRVVEGSLSVALVVAIFVFILPKVADLGEVWGEIRAMTWLEATTLGIAAAWNIITYAFIWMASVPTLTFGQAVVLTEAPTAVANSVPGGSYLSIGLTYSMLHSWGFRRSLITLGVLISGLWNNFAKLALPILALAWLAATGRADAGRIAGASLGVAGLAGAVVVFWLMLRTDATAARVGSTTARAVSPFVRLARRPAPAGWDIAVVRFRRKTIGLLSQRWIWMTTATLVSQLSLYFVLLLALRHVGVSESDVSAAEVLAAFAFARLVTAIPLTPGGVGVVELAITAALVAAGGERAAVLAAVLVFRFATYLAQIPIGAGCYLFWRHNRSWRRDVVPSPEPSEQPDGPERPEQAVTA